MLHKNIHQQSIYSQQTDRLEGEVYIPPSKSHSLRGIFFAVLAKGKTILENVLDSDDIRDALSVCQSFGVTTSCVNNTLVLESKGIPLCAEHMYTGNSGITTHFILPMLGLRDTTNIPIHVNCGDQMQQRPIHGLVDALRSLGLQIDYLQKEARFPMEVSGELAGGETEVDGITSQYISALLLSLPCAKNNSMLKVKALHERSYMEMTLQWLRTRGIQYTHEQHKYEDIFYIPGNQKYAAFHSVIPGDFSSASYVIAAAVMIPGKVMIHGLNMQDTQGDKRLVSLLQKMGANITILPDKLYIEGGNALCGISIDTNDIPDLLPTLAVIGCYASGKTEMRNVPQARMKETDRIHSMTEGLRRMGARIDELHEGMTVYHSLLQSAVVKGYGDHRTVMALSLAGLLAKGITRIDDAEAVDKTFPDFVQCMQSIGANLHMEASYVS